MNYTLSQLAHSKLLPASASAAILEGNAPPVSKLTEHLITTAMDAHFVTTGDPKSSWIDKRLSHQNLCTAFMLAMLLDHTFQPGHSGTVSAAPQEGGLGATTR